MFLDELSHHRTSLASKSYALSAAVGLTVHVKENGPFIAAEKNTMSYKQFNFLKSAFLVYKDVTDDVAGLERSEPVIMTATESREKRVAGRLSSEQKSDSLLRELMSRFVLRRVWSLTCSQNHLEGSDVRHVVSPQRVGWM